MLNIDPKTNKITIINGDTGIIHIQIDNYQLKEGDVLTFTVKKALSNKIPDIRLVCTEDKNNPQGYFTDDGSCIIMLHSEDTLDKDAGSYYYDVQVNLADGRVDTIIGPSKLVINKGVTEPTDDEEVE